MPGYKGHLAGGLFFALMAIIGTVMLGRILLDPLQVTCFVVFCLIGALFPDVDTDSKGQNLYYMLFAAVDLGLILQEKFTWAAWLGFFAMLPAIGSHRGWTHTWWAMVVVPLPILLIPLLTLGTSSLDFFSPFYIAFVTGYFSHLLLDGEFV